MEEVEGETLFVSEDIEKQVIEYVEQKFYPRVYDENQIDEWMNALCEHVVKLLVSRERNMKYMVNGTIIQKVGAGFSSAVSSYINASTDHCISISWPKEKQKEFNNRFFTIIINIHAIAF